MHDRHPAPSLAARHDVVIAGAGPVGLFLACELRLADLSVLVTASTMRSDASMRGERLVPSGVAPGDRFGGTTGVTFEGFVASLKADAPPPSLAAPLVALWWAGRGDWDAAHAIVQDEAGLDEAGRNAAWVHATLHRREGDAANAAYWYRRPGRAAGNGSFAAEWDEIATALLRASPHR